ncbi:MAG: Ig-like domain-containing protein [Chitinophagales bacterium]|nr:Ig-like domain-containing protein [Chitinophagales bacterium]
MNVLLRKPPIMVLLLFFGFPLFSTAQQVVNDTIFENQTFEYTFTSDPNDPALVDAPLYGTISWVEVSPFNYEVVYTPSDGFTGDDSFRFLVWKNTSPFFTYEYLKFNIHVAPSLVTAVHDYGTTTINQPITIDVLANDISSSGVLNLTNIPLVNHGSATFNPGESTITFTPDTDFKGSAYLNYVVCDDIGTCDNGTVSIFVLSNDTPQTDTVSLFTRKNTSQVVFVPPAYVLTTGPTNGTYDDTGEVPYYTPDPDYTGNDYLTYDFNGVDKVIEMIVLDLEENGFAFDDYVYMTPYEGEREINVLENDEYGIMSDCWELTSDAQYGTVEWIIGQDGVGVPRYTPSAGFIGVDWFTYSICPPGGNGSNVETATVYVFVSNYEPSATNFYMTTPKVTPLIVGYSVPISDFSFEVTVDANMGTVEFFEGDVDTVIYGQQVTGYNLVIYTPDANVSSGVDHFELEYCVTTNNICNYQKTVKIDVEILDIGDGTEPMCIDDCIWAGDTNFDGAVNMEDLLPLGLNMGEVGVPRQDVNLSQWYGQYGDDWDAYMPIDLKHLDTDGDSVITGLDTFAISNFYGNTHSLTPAEVPFYEYQIILEGDIFAEPGDLVTMNLLLGTNDDPASNVYGFTFPFQYDENSIEPSSVYVDFTTGSWLSYNSPVLHMSNNNLEGLVESGFTRTNGISASGYGSIGTLSFVIIDDVDVFRKSEEAYQLTIGGGTSTMMNGAGRTFGVNIQGAQITIRPHEEDAPITADQLKVFPNPTSLDFINLHLNGGNEFERAVVYDMTGRMMYDTGKMLSNHTQLPVSDLRNGVYAVQVYTQKGVITKKFEVMR